MANVFDAKNLQIVKDLIQLLNELKISVLEAQKAFDQQSKSQQDTNEKIQELSTTEQQRLKLLDQLNAAQDENAVSNEELKLEVQAQTKANKDAAREKKGLISVYDKESKRLNDLRKKYKDLAIQNKTNTKEAKALQKEITRLDKKLKGIDSSVGQHQRSVGKYSDAMTALPGPIGGVISSLKLLAKAIFATPLGWIIGLIAAAGATLKTFFAGSVEGQERWNVTMEKAKGVMSVFKDELIKTGKRLSNWIDSIKESDEGLKGWFKSVGEGLSGKWNKFKESVSDKGVWETLKDTAKDTYDSIQERQDELYNRLVENALRAESIAQKENSLRRDEIANMTTLARLQSDIAELRAKAADKENTTASQRLALLDDVIEKQNKILAIEENMAKRRIEIQKLQMDQGENTLEDYEKLAELEKAQIDLETTNAERRRRFQGERQTAIREIESEMDSFISRLEAENQAFEDALINSEENITQEIQKQEQARIDSSIKAAKERVDAYKQAEEEIKQFGVDSVNSLFELRTSFRDQEIAALEKQRDFEVAQAEEKGQSTVKIEEKFAKKEQDLRKKQAIQDKVQKIFNAGIDIAAGIIKYASNPITLPLVPVFSALGALQLATIIATPLPKFGYGSGVLDKDTLATVGDRYQHEAVLLPGGGLAFSDNKPQNVMLPAGSQVLSGEQTREYIKDNSINEALMRQMIIQQKETIKAIKKRKTITNRGMTEEGRNYRNSYIK